MQRSSFRLSRPFQACVYLAFGILLLTGAVLMLAQAHPGEPAWASWIPASLKIHGGAAMLALLVLGALKSHIARAWKAGMNRLSGAFLMAFNIFLIVTGYGLYYSGSEELRAWLSRWHAWIGLGIFIVLPAHAIAGRFIIRRRHDRKSSAARSVASPGQR